MKFSKFLILTSFIFALVVNVYAERGPSPQDIEKFKAKKVSFLTEKLEITPEEAQAFWPYYNQFDKEMWETQTKRREIEKKVRDSNGDFSDKEIIKLTEDLVQTVYDEAKLRDEYNKKFLKVLKPQKVLRLYQAEHQFRMEMLHQYRNSRKKD